MTRERAKMLRIAATALLVLLALGVIWQMTRARTPAADPEVAQRASEIERELREAAPEEEAAPALPTSPPEGEPVGRVPRAPR